jgi:hypothetical protein
VKTVRPVVAAATVGAAAVAAVVAVAVAAAVTVAAVATVTNPFPRHHSSFTGEGWSLPVFALFLIPVPIFWTNCLQIVPFSPCSRPDRVLSS